MFLATKKAKIYAKDKYNLILWYITKINTTDSLKASNISTMTNKVIYYNTLKKYLLRTYYVGLRAFNYWAIKFWINKRDEVFDLMELIF